MAEPKPTTVWRWLIAAGVLALASAPAVPLAATALMSPSEQPVWTESFAHTVGTSPVGTSLLLGLGVAVTSLAVGLPLGLVVPLGRFPGRSLLAAAQALPLLLPSFLPAIGWRNLAAAGWFPGVVCPDGFGGCVFVLGLQAVSWYSSPLVRGLGVRPAVGTNSPPRFESTIHTPSAYYRIAVGTAVAGGPRADP